MGLLLYFSKWFFPISKIYLEGLSYCLRELDIHEGYTVLYIAI